MHPSHYLYKDASLIVKVVIDIARNFVSNINMKKDLTNTCAVIIQTTLSGP